MPYVLAPGISRSHLSLTSASGGIRTLGLLWLRAGLDSKPWPVSNSPSGKHAINLDASQLVNDGAFLPLFIVLGGSMTLHVEGL